MIKPSKFWFGTKWLNDEHEHFESVEKLIEFSHKIPLGISLEMKEDLIEAKKLAYEANLVFCVQLAGVLSYGWTMMGFENFLVDLSIDTERAQMVIDLIVERQSAFARDLAELGLEAIHLTDDIAGNNGILVSPNIYREIIKPAIKKIIESCGDAYIIYHSDGNVDPVLNDLIEIGIDAFQSIEYGQMDLKTTKEKYQNLGFLGNVDMTEIHTGTPEIIDALVKECLEAGAIGGRFAISSDNSIP